MFGTELNICTRFTVLMYTGICVTLSIRGVDYFMLPFLDFRR